MLSFIALFPLLCSALHAVNAASHIPRNNHASKNLVATNALAKRYDNARFTYYIDGLGACGGTNSPSDFVSQALIVALNSAQYSQGDWCYKTITVTYQGKSTQAQVVDECPGCPMFGLDMSEGLFSYFASTGAGEIYGSWVEGDGSQPTTTSTKAKPTTTYTPPPPTTSTTKTTATPTTSSTTSTLVQSSSVISSSSIPVTSSSVAPSLSATLSASASSSAISAGVSGAGQVIFQLNEAMLGLAALELAGSQASS